MSPLAIAIAACLTLTGGRPVADQPAAKPAEEWTPKVAVPGFKPSLHGFRFRNSFTGNPVPPALRPLVGPAAPGNFGLCGGMSCAVADFFHAREPVAGTARVPAAGTPLYDFIYQRQTDSLGSGFAMVGSFMQAMRLPDGGTSGAQRLTDLGLHAILAPIARGQPVVVGQVLTRTGGVLWQNHQVLAYGYTARDDGVTIFIYDPNHPGNDRVRMDLTPVVCGLEPPWLPGAGLRIVSGWACTQVVAPLGKGAPPATSRPVRAIFPMPYSTRPIPAALTDPGPPASK